MNARLLFIFSLFLSIYSFGQVTLYSEYFDSQIGKGATGTTPTTDVSDLDWNIDVSGSSLNTIYSFIVRNISGNPAFEAIRRIKTSTWLPPPIDISVHTNITFTFTP